MPKICITTADNCNLSLDISCVPEPAKPKAVKLNIGVINRPGQRITLIGDHMLLLQDDYEVTLFINPTDTVGQRAKIETAVWTLSDPLGVVTIAPAADGLSALVKASKLAIGICQVNLVADSQLGEGEDQLVGTFDIEVVAGKAVNLGITAGVPVPQA